jgi:hypothetical protein
MYVFDEKEESKLIKDLFFFIIDQGGSSSSSLSVYLCTHVINLVQVMAEQLRVRRQKGSEQTLSFF